MRNISFALTTAQVRASVNNIKENLRHPTRPPLPLLKDVTRRLGWTNLKVGERLQACEKCMGRKKGEPLVRICVVEVVSVRREPLNYLLGLPYADDVTERARHGYREYGFKEVIREGFPELSPEQFVDFFCRTHKGCTLDTTVTRIEFKYVS